MGQCLSSDVIVDPGLDPNDSPCCSLCGEAAAAPLRRLPAEEREGWVVLGGQPAHRRCAVARKLEEARLEKERASYGRARKGVYPLPREALHAQHGGELHRVGSGREWAHTGKPLLGATVDGRVGNSFREQYVPASPLARLSARQEQQQAELLGQAAEQQAEQREAASHARQQAVPERAQQRPQCEADDASASPQDVLPAGEHLQHSLATSSSSGGGSGGSGSVDSGGAAHCPPLQRCPSPVHRAALLEAKTLRRRSGQRPSFDGAAMQADLDGGDGGKAWRAQCKAAAEEAQRREERRRAMADHDF
ncbi:hypothetical protein ABPG75_005746 [Micractinium tetrahymenae]